MAIPYFELLDVFGNAYRKYPSNCNSCEIDICEILVSTKSSRSSGICKICKKGEVKVRFGLHHVVS